MLIPDHFVGSRTGAMLRGAAYPLAPRFLWECLTSLIFHGKPFA
jgi:hypothetical protein